MFLPMKNLNLLCLLPILLILFSCSNEDENEPKADYSAVLGVKSVTINGNKINTNSNSPYLDISNTKSVYFNNLTNKVTKKLVEISYAVITEPGTTLSIQVESCYSDVSVVISEVQNSDYTSYVVVVSRKGYQEQITYVFNNKDIGTPFAL